MAFLKIFSYTKNFFSWRQIQCEYYIENYSKVLAINISKPLNAVKTSWDHDEKRAKNNDAVKKSREKTRQKAKETMEKVTHLKQVKIRAILRIC